PEREPVGARLLVQLGLRVRLRGELRARGEAPGLVEEVLQPGLSGGGLVLWHADLRCASTLVRSRRPRATRGRRDGSTVRRGGRPHDRGPRPGECRPVPVRVVTRVRSSEGPLAKRAAGATTSDAGGPAGAAVR